MTARRWVKIYSKTHTANATDDAGDSVDLEMIDVPIQLVVKTSDAGATAPDTGLSFDCQMQHSPPDSDTFSDVASWATTAITSAGTQTAYKEQTGQIGARVRAHVTVAATNWNNGTLVECWLVGRSK